MTKTWRRIVITVIVLMFVYAWSGLAFYQSRSCLTVHHKAQPTVRYSFPLPITFNNNINEGDSTPGNPFADFQTPLIGSQVPQLSVVSNLILLGTLSGPNPQAIVAEKASPGTTHILRQGEVLDGEMIVSIRKGSITVLKGNQRLVLQVIPQ
jgi:hypothetical protein